MLKYINPLIEFLKETRKKNNLSQAELSQKVGIPQSHISKIEAGQVDIQLTSFVEIARTLELEVMLVPRQSIGLVKNIIKNNSPSSDESKPAYVADDNERDFEDEHKNQIF